MSLIEHSSRIFFKSFIVINFYKNRLFEKNTDSFQDRYIIENGKISKYPKIKTGDEETENVNSHIVKDKPNKLEDKDIDKLRIAGEKIASFIKSLN